MKILLADNRITGHHIPYLSALVNNLKQQYAFVLLLPSGGPELGVRTYHYDGYSHDVRGSIRWLREVRRVAEAERADVVHILTGDEFYRFFGLGFGLLKGFKTLVTFHHIRHSFLFRCSIQEISRKIDNGICHTAAIAKTLRSWGIQNCVHIEYPQLGELPLPTRAEARAALGIRGQAPVLAALGEARPTKGLDLLLQALRSVRRPFQLLIAGKEGAFSDRLVKELTEPYADQVILLRRFLTEQELQSCIAAADYLVFPYRKAFDGASGPLTEAAWAGRPVIAAGHGSLGQIVEENHLGYTFASENIRDMAAVIDRALEEPFRLDDTALEYRNEIHVRTFCARYREVYQRMGKHHERID